MLKNPKHEQFAHLVATGTDVATAYEAVGYKRDTKNAQRLAYRDDVSARIDGIRTLLTQNMGITDADIVEEYRRIAFADVTEAVEWGEAMPYLVPNKGGDGERSAVDGDFVLIQGVALKASKDLPVNVRRAISEVRKTKEGIVIKWHSKTEALGKLAQIRGMLVEKSEVTTRMTLEQLVLASYSVKVEGPDEPT